MMGKIALMLWVIIAPMVGGVLFLIGLNIPALANNGLVLAALAIVGFVVAIPVSVVVAKKTVESTQPPQKA